MFVFKAAVVGAGTMGGQIAQTIAAAGIPVVLKDIKQELVDAGLDEARNVTAGPVRQARREGQDHRGAGRRADRGGPRAHRRARPTYDGFGDVDFVIEAVPERMEIKQAVFAELDAVHAGPRDPRLEHLVAVDHRDRRGDAAARQGRRLPLLLPGVGHAADRDRRGRRHLAGDASARRSRSRRRSSKQPITCAEVPGFVVNRILNSGISEVWRAQEEQGLSIKKIDEGVGAAERRADGRRTSSSTCSASTPCCTSPSTSTSPTATASTSPRACSELVADGKLGAKTGGDGFYDADGEPNLEGDGEPDVDELVELLTLKTFVEACLVLEEGVATHRDIDFGMMAGAGLDPRRGLLPPFMKADVEGLDTILERLESAQEQHGERFAPPTILRRLVAQGRLGHEDRPGLLRLPAGRRRAARRRRGVVKLETRGDVAIAWLANGQMNSISPQVIADLRQGLGRRSRRAGVRALVIASSNPFLFSAGADIKAFTQLDEAAGARADRRRARAVARARRARASRRSPRSTAWPSAAAASWRWPATCASPRTRRSSASPRSSSGSSPASAAPSACRASSARTRRSR